MSQVSPRAIPKWPVHYSQAFSLIDPLSLVLGIGSGALLFYLTQKFVVKKCIR